MSAPEGTPPAARRPPIEKLPQGITGSNTETPAQTGLAARQGGVDQIELRAQCREGATPLDIWNEPGHTLRPGAYGRSRFVSERQGRLVGPFGVNTLWRERDRMLWLDLHAPRPAGLVPFADVVAYAGERANWFHEMGVEIEPGGWRVTRADVAADVTFAEASTAREFMRTVARTRQPYGRRTVVPDAETLGVYVKSRNGRGTLGIVYDKGLEQQQERSEWIRCESRFRQNGETAPPLATMSEDFLRATWDAVFTKMIPADATEVTSSYPLRAVTDRFRRGIVTARQAERLACFVALDAHDPGQLLLLYSTRELAEIKLLARKLGIPTEGVATEDGEFVLSDLGAVLGEFRSALDSPSTTDSP